MAAPTTWSDAVPPGGEVCAVPIPGERDEICGMPVESEPCREHTRCVHPTCGHDSIDHDAGECWARVDSKQCPCPWYTPAYEAAAR